MKMRKILSAFLAALMLLSTVMAGVSVVSGATTITYSDVTEDMWSYEDIAYVTENGLMNGTGGSAFSPQVDVTRAMVVTVLYRMEGSPKQEYRELFLDVADRQFYSEAVTWAKENKIVTATQVTEWGEEYFSPSRAITRQELATMFVRYAEYAHVITESSATLDKFTDKASVADWADAAMKWATGTGLINGTGNGSTLSPTLTATREQFAAIIHRFNTLPFDYELAYETPTYGKYTEKDYSHVKDADLYVAVDGDDKNAGTLDKPLATFEGAVAKVRELKKTAKDEIVVAFKAGNYGRLDLRLTKEDTGTADVPIKYCAYGDGEVIFSNGIEVKENDFVKISEDEKSKFADSAADYIYKCDISDQLADGMDLSNAIMFSTTATCNIARYPNYNNLHNHTDRVDDKSIIFTIAGSKRDVDTFGDLAGTKVMGYFKYEWLGEEYTIESYDKATGIMTFTNGGSYGIGSENNDGNGECVHSFYMYDFPAALDYKGEYYIDREAKVLYAYNPKGDYMLALGGDMVWFDGNVDHVSLVKLTFQGTTDTAFYGEACDYITIDQCKFYAIGGEHAVGFSYTKANYSAMNGTTPSSKYVGSSHITFTNNEMSFCAKGCFRAYGANRDRGNAKKQAQYGWGEDFYYLELVDDGSLIENNSIHDFGWGDPFNSSGISVTAFFGLDIRHNEIYNAAREAVGLNGQCRNTNFEYNVIHHAMQQSDDGGAFYHGRSHEAKGNVIRYNIFHDIHTGAGRYAIYLDDGMSGQEVYGNVFYNAGDVAVLMNGGRDNYIHDNFFIVTSGNRRALWTNDKYYGAAESGDEEYIADAAKGFYDSYKNLENLTDAQKKRWMEEYPEMFEIITDYTQYENPMCYITPTSKYENNFMVNEPWNNTQYFDFDDPSLKFATIKNNVAELSLEENDYFVDPTHGNYAIRDGAKFMDNHFDKIGRY